MFWKVSKALISSILHLRDEKGHPPARPPNSYCPRTIFEENPPKTRKAVNEGLSLWAPSPACSPLTAPLDSLGQLIKGFQTTHQRGWSGCAHDTPPPLRILYQLRTDARSQRKIRQSICFMKGPHKYTITAKVTASTKAYDVKGHSLWPNGSFLFIHSPLTKSRWSSPGGKLHLQTRSQSSQPLRARLPSQLHRGPFRVLEKAFHATTPSQMGPRGSSAKPVPFTGRHTWEGLFYFSPPHCSKHLLGCQGCARKKVPAFGKPNPAGVKARDSGRSVLACTGRTTEVLGEEQRQDVHPRAVLTAEVISEASVKGGVA